MSERVGIISVAQTKYHPNRADVSEEELSYEAIKQVLEETGLSLRYRLGRHMFPGLLGWQNHIQHEYPARCWCTFRT